MSHLRRMMTTEMRIGLYVGCVIGEAKTSNTLVLSVAINRCVTPGKCSDIWIAEHTVSALKKNMASVGCWIGSRHWYPLFSNKNQIPNPQVDASMWIVSIEWPTLSSCHTTNLKKNNPGDCWTCSTNHASSCWTILLIFILPYIWIFPASWPASLNHSYSIFELPQVNSWMELMCCSHFSMLRYTDIVLVSTSNPSMVMVLPEICFFSVCGRSILSHRCKILAWSVGMVHWYSSYQLTFSALVTENASLM